MQRAARHAAPFLAARRHPAEGVGLPPKPWRCGRGCRHTGLRAAGAATITCEPTAQQQHPLQQGAPRHGRGAGCAGGGCIVVHSAGARHARPPPAAAATCDRVGVRRVPHLHPLLQATTAATDTTHPQWMLPQPAAPGAWRSVALAPLARRRGFAPDAAAAPAYAHARREEEGGAEQAPQQPPAAAAAAAGDVAGHGEIEEWMDSEDLDEDEDEDVDADWEADMEDGERAAAGGAGEEEVEGAPCLVSHPPWGLPPRRRCCVVQRCSCRWTSWTTWICRDLLMQMRMGTTGWTCGRTGRASLAWSLVRRLRGASGVGGVLSGRTGGRGGLSGTAGVRVLQRRTRRQGAQAAGAAGGVGGARASAAHALPAHPPRAAQRMRCLR